MIFDPFSRDGYLSTVIYSKMSIYSVSNASSLCRILEPQEQITVKKMPLQAFCFSSCHLTRELQRDAHLKDFKIWRYYRPIKITTQAWESLISNRITWLAFTDTIEKLLTDKADLDSEMSSALHEAREAEKEAKSLLETKEKELEDLQQRLAQVESSKPDRPAELPVTTERLV